MMKDLSLHLLDIAQNSLTAQSTLVEILLEERGDGRTLTIRDDGKGMSPEFLAKVMDPFTTTRTTRKVGMGLPLLRMACELSGGSLDIQSTVGVGTTVTAKFSLTAIDCLPLGDMPSTVSALVQGLPDGVELTFTHTTDKGTYTLDTRQVREMLGPDVPLSLPDVAVWVAGYIEEGEEAVALPSRF